MRGGAVRAGLFTTSCMYCLRVSAVCTTNTANSSSMICMLLSAKQRERACVQGNYQRVCSAHASATAGTRANHERTSLCVFLACVELCTTAIKFASCDLCSIKVTACAVCLGLRSVSACVYNESSSARARARVCVCLPCA